MKETQLYLFPDAFYIRIPTLAVNKESKKKGKSTQVMLFHHRAAQFQVKERKKKRQQL